MTVPNEILRLVERFEEQRESYRSGKYKEAQLRSEFLDPLFEALGWDVYNRQGYAEAYKDVIHEDAIKVGGATKAPDYCFRVGGTRKFFVEAKKPSVDIKEAVHPAYQLRRYAWSAKLPLSILTDFEEFAAYDCRVKPARADKASTARTIYMTFSDYTERWDEVASIFAKESVLKGSFDKYVDTTRRKRGTAEVDDAFLKEIESWRDSLARNIALRNPKLTQRELNFAVQRTIDRIIFLRICEDRGIEHYGQLSALQNGTEIYSRLRRLFYSADDRYNSGLFHFRKEKDRPDAPDELTPRLTIDDRPLKDIVKRLYYPESPYEFSVLPADILGQVYEQFLGKVIRLTPAHHAVVEDKPEVKKAGGIYYTPTYIVDYIVKNTVGKLLGDPGTGSGGPDSGKGGENDGTENLSRPGGVAKGDGLGGDCLSADKAVPSEGEIRPDQPAAEGGNLGPGKHRRGIRQNPSGGLSASPLDSQWLPDGGGDPLDHSHAPRLREQGAGPPGLGTDSASRQDANQTHRRSKETLPPNPQTRSSQPQPLNPKPDPPTPNPRSLTPKQASKLRILDPACGSGSFLIGAYQYLLDWHLNWYTTHDPQKWARKKNPPIYQTPNPRPPAPGPQSPNPKPDPRPPSYRLTTSERKRILLNNIYGVDIDPQAVEVTKLSLLLKVLEGENEQTLERQFKFFHERALPDLSDNIKCGNSLIGPDFYDNQQMTLLDDDERYRINAFDWNAEFPHIMKSGGFHAVIGNPPWGGDIDKELGYLHARYPSSTQEHTDSFKIFVDAALRLATNGAIVSMIVPNTLLRQGRIKDVRRLLLQNQVKAVVDLGEDVFHGVTAPSCMFVVRVSRPPESHKTRLLDARRCTEADRAAALAGAARTFAVHQRLFASNPELAFADGVAKLAAPVLRIADFAELQPRDAGINYQRVRVGMREKGKSDLGQRLLYEGKRETSAHKMFWKGSDIDRYWIAETTNRFCRPDYEAFIRPNEVVHLNVPVYEAVPKILLRQTADHIVATIDDRGVWFGRSVIALVPAPGTTHAVQYLLGLLNSSYLSWRYDRLAHETGRVFAQVKLSRIKELPIRIIDFSNRADKARHDGMVELVDRMLDLHKKLAAAKTDHDKTVLQRQIDTTDNQIDQLVYQLYGLTDDEIKILEEETTTRKSRHRPRRSP